MNHQTSHFKVHKGKTTPSQWQPGLSILIAFEKIKIAYPEFIAQI
jgi:hypothetical protein